MKKIFGLRLTSFLPLLAIVLTLIVVISYLSLLKLIFIGNDIMMGSENMCVTAERVRQKLVQQHHAQSFLCTTDDNVALHGLIIERKKPIATLLLCHGYRCCKELTVGYVDLFPECNTVMFDFRAHGENKKMLTTVGCHEHKDISTTIHWLKENKPELFKVPFVILGVSMGGAASLRAVENDPTLCDALIIDSSFACLKSVLYSTFINRSGLPAFPFFPIMSKMFNYLGSCDLNAMNPVESIKNIKKPLLLIHACIDPFIPVQESLLMYAHAAKTGAKLWIAPPCEHGWLHKRYPDLFRKKVMKFLCKNVCKKDASTPLTSVNLSDTPDIKV